MNFQPVSGLNSESKVLSAAQRGCLASAVASASTQPPPSLHSPWSTFLLYAFTLKSAHQMFMSSSGDKENKKPVQEKKYPLKVKRLEPELEGGWVGVMDGCLQGCSFHLLQLPGRRNAAEEERLHFSSLEEPQAATAGLQPNIENRASQTRLQG